MSGPLARINAFYLQLRLLLVFLDVDDNLSPRSSAAKGFQCWSDSFKTLVDLAKDGWFQLFLLHHLQ